MTRLYSVCLKFSGGRQGGNTDRKDGLQGSITFEKQTPSASPISSICLKSEPFTSRLASSVVRLAALKCMDSALGQCQPRSRLTPTGCQATVRTHSARGGVRWEPARPLRAGPEPRGARLCMQAPKPHSPVRPQ